MISSSKFFKSLNRINAATECQSEILSDNIFTIISPSSLLIRMGFKKPSVNLECNYEAECVHTPISNKIDLANNIWSTKGCEYIKKHQLCQCDNVQNSTFSLRFVCFRLIICNRHFSNSI